MINEMSLLLAQGLVGSGRLRYSRKVKTASFDGHTILINRRWFNGLPMCQRIAVLDHLLLHFTVAGDYPFALHATLNKGRMNRRAGKRGAK